MGAFACAVAVVRPGGEPPRWTPEVSAAAHDPGLRLPTPMPTPRVLPSAGAVPVLAVSAPAITRSARTTTAPRRASRPAVPVDEVADRPRTPAVAAPLTTTAATATPDAAPKPDPAAGPTLTKSAGAAVAATARGAGDAVAPVSPQTADAVAATGQAVGDAIAGLGG